MSEPEPPEENVIEIRGLPQSPSGRLASEPKRATAPTEPVKPAKQPYPQRSDGPDYLVASLPIVKDDSKPMLGEMIGVDTLGQRMSG